jgi:hypothetical protein
MNESLNDRSRLRRSAGLQNLAPVTPRVLPLLRNLDGPNVRERIVVSRLHRAERIAIDKTLKLDPELIL